MPRAKGDFRGKAVTVYLKADRLRFLDSINLNTTLAIHSLIDQSISNSPTPKSKSKRIPITQPDCGHTERVTGCTQCRNKALGIR